MRRWERVVLAALSVLMLLGAISYVWQSPRLFRAETRPTGIVELSERTGITFPKSAAVGQSHFFGYVIGMRIWAEVTIPATDMSKLTSSAVRGQALVFDAEYQPQGAAATGAPSWWPESPQLPGTAIDLRQDNWVELLIDEADSETTTVWLYWHSG